MQFVVLHEKELSEYGSSFCTTMNVNYFHVVAHNRFSSSITCRPTDLATNITETKDANSGSKGSNER